MVKYMVLLLHVRKPAKSGRAAGGWRRVLRPPARRSRCPASSSR
jgi:hypothetical protein